MDVETWKLWQKEYEFSDEDMVYFYGNPGDPIDYTDVDDFFNSGKQLEGPAPKKFYREKLLTNEARCLTCKDVIMSRHTHDWQKCSCGNLTVDGGLSYNKRSYRDGRDSWEELSEIVQEEREPYEWEIEK
jgi:hypothetical protein